MDERYVPEQIEAKWQQAWKEAKLFRATEEGGKPKFYGLDFFPYPSGNGLSVGHCRNYIPTDVLCRFMRMNGRNVMHPMGWDAFGLPAENEAIKKNSHPNQTVPAYIANYTRQMNLVGISFDWEREVNSSSPDYYKWTQWFFLLLFKRGLAYRSGAPANWCGSCSTVLANEEVENGNCWRCGNPVEKKNLPQWFFKITDYADRLADDLDTVDWPDGIKMMQRNWIGRSEGVQFTMPITGSDKSFEVFTTRVDTVFGMSFAVLAPEHPLVAEITTPECMAAVEEYVAEAKRTSEIDRLSTEHERTGVFTGAYAINPVNGEKLPLFIADYVLAGYGSGAIMAVPAHDSRDYDFAKQQNLPITVVIRPDGWDGSDFTEAYTEPGTMMNSGEFDGMGSIAAKSAIADWMEAHKVGHRVVNYRLRDWLISRQRYWGAPIPIIHCPKCGAVPVPDDQLPVVLPDVENYKPTGDGRSPLALISDFVNVCCPKCGGLASRETDTMGGFACSSWYFLRFASPKEDDRPFDPEKVKYWLPVDTYVGGAEHAVMHLLYARFWTKVMYDADLIDFIEPFSNLKNQGMVLAPDPKNPGTMIKMSKSKGNVITPDEVVSKFGADTLRLYELFVAPFDQTIEWRDEGVAGGNRFLGRVWRLVGELRGSFDAKYAKKLTELDANERALRRKTHQVTAKVADDIQRFSYNTAVAVIMEWVNLIYDMKSKIPGSPALSEAIEYLVLVLSPICPHLCDELWQEIGHTGFTQKQDWPKVDDAAVAAEALTIVLQVNGKLRDSISVPVGTDKQTLEELALAHPTVKRFSEGMTVRKVIVVPGKLVNVVAN